MLGIFYPYGIVLQALAILHFVRRRPDTYWILVILMFGGIGALIYLAVEAAPDVGLLRGAFDVFPRRKRIQQLEAIVLDNPAIGNYEELGDLYLDDQQFARARECFDRVIAKSDSIDPFYRRALCELALEDFTAAAADLEQVIARDAKYDLHRAEGLVRACPRQDRRTRKGGGAVRGRHRDVDALGNPVQLRVLPRRRRARQPRPANGPSASSARRRRCPTTFGGGNVPGSRKAAALLKRLPRT